MKVSVRILREADETPLPEVAKKHGVSEATLYAWRKRFGTMDVSPGPDECGGSPRARRANSSSITRFDQMRSNRNLDAAVAVVNESVLEPAVIAGHSFRKKDLR
jgi:transposase-like protein